MKFKILSITALILIGLAFVSAVSITDVSTTPEQVNPGQVVQIAIEVENTFNYDITNLNIKLDLSSKEVPFAPYQSSSEKFLDELDEGDRENFKFELISLPEASTGIYKIPLAINYNYKGKNATILNGQKSGLISVIVNSEPRLEISLDNSIILIKGKENILTLKAINSGLSDIKFLYVNVGEANGIKFLDGTKKYLGDIDSDDFDNVDYKIIVNSDAPKTLTLPVTLKFMDATNKEFTKTTNLVLKTYSLKEARSLGLIKKSKIAQYLVIILFILAYILYRAFRKRKLKKKRS